MSLSTKKIILAIPLIVFSFMLPCVANAALSPLTDTQCWTREMCLGRTHDCDHCFKEGEGQCSAPFGRCYHPHEPIDLQIHLGSTGQVTDMAEYISLAYSYVLSIGSILAVVVIIASGIIYLTAGGNPSRIGQAKEYIGGAVVGVILLFTSYLILNTLNPDLVRLKMPSISMIRPADIPATFCADVRWNTGNTENNRPLFFRADDVAHDGDSPTDPRRLKDYAEATSSGGRNYDPEQLTCNFAFYSPTVAGEPCYGSGGCEPDADGNPSICARDPDPAKRDWYTCQRGYVTGDIEYGIETYDLYGSGNQLQVIKMQIRALCGDNTRETLGTVLNLDEDAMPRYVLNFSTMASLIESGETYEQHLRESTCSNHNGLRGIFLGMQLQENDMAMDDGSMDGNTEETSYQFYFGKSACTNTSSNPYSVTFRRYGGGGRWQIWQDIPPEELWSFDEIFSETTRVRCNLRIENHHDSFPVIE